MSKFVVNLNESPKDSPPTAVAAQTFTENQNAARKPGVFLKILKIFGVALILFLVISAASGYFYWRNLKTTPQYSLALLVDAARRGDQAAVDKLVDTDAVVDDFMPQITGKAVELYGRGLAPATIQKITKVAAPFLPAVKQRARAEVPALIREKTSQFENIPFWAIAAGAERYLDITAEGDRAFVRSQDPNRPLEAVLKRSADERWQVIGVKDEILARRIAERIGQDLITGAKNGNLKKAGEQFGVSNLEDVLKNADVFK
jgi:hypothetical protein